MLHARRSSSGDARGQRGQILVLFTFVLVALLAMLSLLFDGGSAITLRRQLQNAGDAAALAGANVIQSLATRGCSATAGPPPGAPQAAVVTAVQNAVYASLPWVSNSDITVTCPNDWTTNYAVQVDLRGVSQSYFGRVVGINSLTASTMSQAVNGQVANTIYSIIQLDPSNSSWPQGRRGCPSVLFTGGPTVVLEGSMVVDSACSAANGGAFATNGSGGSATLNNNSQMLLVGGYNAGSMTITPAPLTGQPYVKDPLLGLETIPSLTTVSASTLVLNNANQVINPGVYVGGIQLKNSSIAYMKPGIYVMQGGGFDMGAQSKVFSIPSTLNSTTDATWATDCPKATCGVLIFNTSGSGGTAMGQFTIGAGATLRLRPYVPSADGTGARIGAYANLLLWQDANPVPTISAGQPIVALNGGGNVNISGTIYAPSAQVTMGGSSGGSGGATDVTLQFITWDLTLSGNSAFYFRFQNSDFAKPTDYGLIK